MKRYLPAPRLLVIVAVILFVFAAFGFTLRVGLVALGLAVWALADALE